MSADTRKVSQLSVSVAGHPGADSDNGLGDEHEHFCYCDECLERKRQRQRRELHEFQMARLKPADILRYD